MTQKSDAKFEEKLTCCLKNDKHVSHVYTLIASYCAKCLMFDLSTEELSFMKMKSDAKFKEKLACGLENDMKNLAKFHQTTQNLKIGTLMGSFCPK